MKRITIAAVLPILFTACLAAADGAGTGGDSHGTAPGTSVPDNNAQGTTVPGTPAPGTNAPGAAAPGGGMLNADDAGVRDARLSAQDRDFIAAACSGGRFEIESSQWARKHGLAGDAANIAVMMINDHQVMAKRLGEILAQKGVNGSDDLNDADAKALKQLEKTPDDQLGKAYIDAQVAAHQAAIAAFTSEAEHGRDADLRTFASSNLPVLRKHLEHVQPLQ
jgi:putative membrane protein